MALDYNDIEVLLNNTSRLWVFGYGSILWKTGFKYRTKRTGFVRGFARRFWQGNNSHRGTPEKPGRVATLVPEKNEQVWGCAYLLEGRKMIRQALEHLGLRECVLGGYSIQMVEFCPRECRGPCRAGCDEHSPCRGHDCSCLLDRHEDANDTFHTSHSASDITTLLDDSRQPFPTLLFNATPDNEHYMGNAPVEALANQIVDCKGPSGHNVEYVIKLAEYIRNFIPEDEDHHLFSLELAVRTILWQRGLMPEDLYGCPGDIRLRTISVTTPVSNRRMIYSKHSNGENEELRNRGCM